MTLHREGTTTIIIAVIILGLIQWGNYWLYTKTDWLWLFLLLSAGALVMLYLVVQFFRIPKRTFTFTDSDILCPADGKVVVIEEVEETEYFKDRRIQVSDQRVGEICEIPQRIVFGCVASEKLHG